jgi:outer membrane protein TolC
MVCTRKTVDSLLAFVFTVAVMWSSDTAADTLFLKLSSNLGAKTCTPTAPSCISEIAGAKPQYLSYAEALRSALQLSTTSQNERLDYILQQAQLQSVESGYSLKPYLSGSSQKQWSSASTTNTLTTGTSWLSQTGSQLNATLTRSSMVSAADGLMSANQQSTRTLELVQHLLQGAGGAARYPLDLARLSERMSEFTRNQTLDNIFAMTSQAYYAAWIAKKGQALAERSLERVRLSKEINFSLYQAGRLAKVDLLQTDADVAQAELNLRQLSNAALDSMNSLMQLLGPEWSERQPTDVLLAESLPELPLVELPHMPDQLMVQAQASRPDILMAQAAINMARIGVARAKDASLPILDLTLGVTSPSYSSGGSPGMQPSIGLKWSIPLDQGPLRLQRLQSQVELQRAELAFASTLRQARIDVTTALRTLEFVQNQEKLTEVNVELNGRKFEAETERFRYGKTSAFQLSAAQAELTLVENAQLEIKLAMQGAKIQFARATGSLAAQRKKILQDNQ